MLPNEFPDPVGVDPRTEVLRKRREARERGLLERQALRLTSITVETARDERRRRARRKETLAGLIARGELSSGCQAAAEELQTVYLLRQDGQLRVVPLAERVDTFLRGGAGHLMDCGVINFARWRKALETGAYGFGERGPLTLRATVMVVVEDASLRESEKRIGIRNGTAGELVRLGLQLYADIREGRMGRVRLDPALKRRA